MTVTATNDLTGPFDGNGSTTVFGFTFEVSVEGEVEVLLQAATGVETIQTLTTHYTVSISADGTGSVTMVTPPATDERLILRRVTSPTQAVARTQTVAHTPSAQEDAWDKSTRIAQEALGQAQRQGARLSTGLGTTRPEWLLVDELRADNTGTTLEFLHDFDRFDAIKVVLDALTPATADQQAWLEFTPDGGTLWTHANHQVNWTGAGWAAEVAFTGEKLDQALPVAGDAVAGQYVGLHATDHWYGISGEVVLPWVRGHEGAQAKSIINGTAESYWINDAANRCYMRKAFTLKHGTTSQYWNGLRFKFTAGNIYSGHVRLYAR